MDIDFDKEHIWHPYTSTINPLPCYPVTKAVGNKIQLDNNKELIDGMSSWWASIHGYNHPRLNEAVKKQLDDFSHVMFGGLTHEPAIALCKRLIDMTPDNLEKVFLSDSGSVAVEVALKMALQYWHSKGEDRSTFLTLRDGYHGDTFAAMSVTDPDNSMHRIYKGFLPEHIFCPSPTIGFREQWHSSALNDFRRNIEQHKHDLAAVILEPIVQGAGGMRFYHPEFLKGVRSLCTQHNVLLIVDEIATGFGRTGKLFACEHANIQPDIMCIGKALTGGYMSLAATLTSKDIADTICSGDANCFMHGPTFMANPLACAVATASIDLINEGHWKYQVKSIEEVFAKQLPALLYHTMVKEIRYLGAIGVVETHHPVDMEKIQAYFVKQGGWIRPFGRLIYLMPPYLSPKEDIEKLIMIIDSACQDTHLFLSHVG
ncbi:adenosylmethionine--8-amino-7-oxononanoate transaminase [Vibrio sp.]|nr:adenosylmethionine--8-amino-7-oxononanoate transaminase [Vibrio sp.]